MTFVRFMEGIGGRSLRIAAGLVLVVVGAVLGGPWWVLAAVGLVPIAAGVFNFCLVAPFVGAPLRPHSSGA